jgi:hypothetical protein
VSSKSVSILGVPGGGFVIPAGMWKTIAWSVLTWALFWPELAGAAGSVAAVHPMVPMFHRWDYEKSVERIARVAETEARRVSFTVLLLSELEPGFKVRNFGAVWPRRKEDGAVEYVFQPMTPAMRQEIGAALRTAFAEAVKRGLEINVLPQIDASGAITEWRNFFDFDPTVKCGEFSYESAMLETILESLEAVVPAGHPVEMTLEGEMGCSLFTHPDKWRAVLERQRTRGKLTKLRLGISANYEGVTGKVKPDAAQQEGMKRLIAASDFIGLSCYANVGVPPVPEDFRRCVEKFVQEFADAGCPIPPDKPLRWTELGHGGGGFDAEWKLKVPGPMVERLGNAAFFGTDKPEENPWNDEARVNFRRQFYRAALDSLTTLSAPWKVETAYLWSYGSWDVHGIHGTVFGDATIAGEIRKHNAAAEAKNKE